MNIIEFAILNVLMLAGFIVIFFGVSSLSAKEVNRKYELLSKINKGEGK